MPKVPKPSKEPKISSKRAGGAAAEEICQVQGCKEKVERSVPKDKFVKSITDLELEGSSRRAHVCKEHYRSFRKATKKDRELDSLGR